MFTWNVFAIISCLTFALSSREKDFCSSSFICVHGGNRSGTHLTTAALPKRLLHMKFSGTAKVASSNSLKIFDRGSSQLSVKSVCLYLLSVPSVGVKIVSCLHFPTNSLKIAYLLLKRVTINLTCGFHHLD